MISVNNPKTKYFGIILTLILGNFSCLQKDETTSSDSDSLSSSKEQFIPPTKVYLTLIDENDLKNIKIDNKGRLTTTFEEPEFVWNTKLIANNQKSDQTSEELSYEVVTIIGSFTCDITKSYDKTILPFMSGCDDLTLSDTTQIFGGEEPLHYEQAKRGFFLLSYIPSQKTKAKEEPKFDLSMGKISGAKKSFGSRVQGAFLKVKDKLVHQFGTSDIKVRKHTSYKVREFNAEFRSKLTADEMDINARRIIGAKTNYFQVKQKMFGVAMNKNYSMKAYEDAHGVLKEMIGGQKFQDLSLKDQTIILRQQKELLDIIWDKIRRTKKHRSKSKTYGSEQELLAQRKIYDDLTKKTEEQMHHIEENFLRGDQKATLKDIESLLNEQNQIAKEKYIRFERINSVYKPESFKDWDEMQDNIWTSIAKRKKRKILLLDAKKRIDNGENPDVVIENFNIQLGELKDMKLREYDKPLFSPNDALNKAGQGLETAQQIGAPHEAGRQKKADKQLRIAERAKEQLLSRADNPKDTLFPTKKTTSTNAPHVSSFGLVQKEQEGLLSQKVDETSNATNPAEKNLLSAFFKENYLELKKIIAGKERSTMKEKSFKDWAHYLTNLAILIPEEQFQLNQNQNNTGYIIKELTELNTNLDKIKEAKEELSSLKPTTVENYEETLLSYQIQLSNANMAKLIDFEIDPKEQKTSNKE